MSLRDTLTPRQLEVLRLHCDGLNGRQIAARLGITHNTVLLNKGQARQRVGAETQADLVELARQKGWVRSRVPSDDDLEYLREVYVPLLASLQRDINRILAEYDEKATTE